MSDTTRHECPGPGCKQKVPYDMLACRRHWFQVSGATRRRVYKAWAGAAGAGTDEHTQAIEQAISEMSP